MTTSYNNAAKSVLSIILRNGRQAFEEAETYLSGEHFVKMNYKVIWNACKWLYDDGSTINKNSVLKCLEVQKDSEDNPVIKYLSSSGKYDEALSNIRNFADKDKIDDIYTYARMMLDEFVVAKNREMCEQVMLEKTAGKQIKIIEDYAKFWHTSDTKKYETASDIMLEMGKLAEKGTGLHKTEIRNSVPFLSEYLSMSPGNTTVIAGDTSHGKTSVALQLVYDIARQRTPIIDKETGRPVLDEMFLEISRPRTILLLSLEMEKHEIMGKLFCNRFNMSWDEMKALPDEKFAKLAKEMAKIMKDEMPNLVIESGSMTLNDCVKHCAVVEKKFGALDLVVIDHIGLLDDVYAKSFEAQHEKYAYASRFCKMKIAVSMNTHCLLLSQLNKASIDKYGKINHLPTVDRLFGASGIKQDASNIIFIYRENKIPEETTIIQAGNKPIQINTFFMVRLLVAKSRFGEYTSPKPVGYIPYLQRIIPLSKINEFGLLHSNDSKFRLSPEQFDEIGGA